MRRGENLIPNQFFFIVHFSNGRLGNDARGASRVGKLRRAQNLRVRENKTAIIISFLLDCVCHSRWFIVEPRDQKECMTRVYDMREAHVVPVSWCVVSGFLLRLFVTFFITVVTLPGRYRSDDLSRKSRIKNTSISVFFSSFFYPQKNHG